MKFCPYCGAQVQVTDSKFCHECGKSLQSNVPNGQASTIEPSHPERELQESEGLLPVTPKAYDLGKNLENIVADIHRKMGYNVELRRQIRGKSGVLSEIDVLVTRGNRRKAIECKNYEASRTIETSLMRVFINKLQDTEIYDGLFVTLSNFSEDSLQLGDHQGIDHWNGEEVREKYWSHLTGRAPTLPQQLVLPLRQSFSEASTLKLRNSVLVNLFDRVLFYHPYYVIKYRLLSVRSDPKGKRHKVTDEGTSIIDTLDGHILNVERGFLSVVGGFLKSKEQRLASKEDGLVANDLLNIVPTMEALTKSSEYEVTTSDPSITLADAIRIARFYVIENNTREVNYEVTVRGEPETRTMKIVPKMNEVAIRSQKTVYVPIWELDYEAGRRSFERRSVASSGAIIKDDLSRCGRCTLLRGENVAVCEVCGLPLCEKHALQEGQKWLCENDVSDSLRKQIKASKMTSKAFGKLKSFGAKLTGQDEKPS